VVTGKASVPAGITAAKVTAGATALQTLTKLGGVVLSSTDSGDRRVVAKKVIPHAIAMVVHILNRAAERLVL